MASQGPPPSSLPPSMGPGAHPVQPGNTSRVQMWDRSTYKVQIDSEYLTLKYTPRDRGEVQQHVSFNNLPLGSFKRWLLYGGPQRAYSSGIYAIDTIRVFEGLVERQLTPREAEGLVYLTSNTEVYAITGSLVGCLAGSTYAWRTREKMKFPLRAAQPLERYNNFPNRYLPILRGSVAQTAWHITRANVWAAAGVMAIRPLFAAMGNYALWSGLAEDERTKDLPPLIQANSKERRQRGENTRTRGPHQAQHIKAQDDLQSQALDQDQAYTLDQAPQDWDQQTFSKNDSETRDFRGPGDFKPTEPVAPSVSGRGNSHSFPNPNKPPANADVFFDDDDDASPTAGQALRPESQGGSAWDRIRKGESSGPSSRQAQNQGYTPNSPSPTSPRGWRRVGTQKQDAQFENSADSFSFSKTEADKQFGREQAQKDFDDMLDRERRQSGSDDYDRGMKAVESGQENPTNSDLSLWEQRRRRN
ncbi:uncharacterized protein A1O9_08253 [Exophiala aquamarina CBS 119918]|uniref:Uncharacterized protein n=1 Tax=Exophiala aquamarina CBS 119918 TaxID=1182545 RepID=A0A072P876_9EURO|nr:uncharacterized protein A1O9_08253 [Exophiala aquamarina CBS 119918]KEF55503.1 hypothetical protein A1O9_08253 [Exophiala aquamarina CBS 119918]